MIGGVEQTNLLHHNETVHLLRSACWASPSHSAGTRGDHNGQAGFILKLKRTSYGYFIGSPPLFRLPSPIRTLFLLRTPDVGVVV